MSDILDFYQSQAKQSLLKGTWVSQCQKNAWADVKRLGLPTRHQEAWKYMAAEPLTGQQFNPVQLAQHLEPHAVSVMAAGRQADAPLGLKVALVDGVVLGLDAILSQLPPGVIVQPL